MTDSFLLDNADTPDRLSSLFDSHLWAFLLSSQDNIVISLVCNFPYLSYGLKCTHRKYVVLLFEILWFGFVSFLTKCHHCLYTVHIVLLLTINLILGLVYSEAYAFRYKNMICSLNSAQNVPSGTTVFMLYTRHMAAKIIIITLQTNVWRTWNGLYS